MTQLGSSTYEATLKAKAQTVKTVCDALLAGDADAARAAGVNYAFVRPQRTKRAYNRKRATAILLRDGFVDRYSGARVIFPGALFLLSTLLPDEFPSHPNWKMTETHMMYWELFPELDHVNPLAAGGADTDDNLVTTSVLRNCIKANWTLEQLQWSKKPCGDLNEWDGLLGWFMRYIEKDSSPLTDKRLKNWHEAAKQALAEPAMRD